MKPATRRIPRTAATAALLAAWSLGLSLWSIARHFEGGITWEFCQYAEIGRNLDQGRGFRTGAVTPYVLAWLDERHIPFDDEHLAPVLDRFPLQAALSAAAQALVGYGDFALAALAAALLAAAVAATFLLGTALFSYEIGAAAGFILALNPSLLRGFLLWGQPDIGFLVVVAAAGAAACAERRPQNEARRVFVAGALSGLAWLTRSNFIVWLPLFAVAVAVPFGKGFGRRAGLYLGGFALAAAPGWIYNVAWFGSPNPPTLAWNLAHKTVSAAQPWLSYRVISVGEVLNNFAPALGQKFRMLLAAQWADFPALWQCQPLWPFALIGAVAALLSREKSADAARRWTALTLAMLIVHVVVFSFLRRETLGALVGGRYLLWFAPAVVLLAARGAAAIGGRFARERSAPWMLAAVAAVWFVRFLAMPQGGSAFPGGARPADWPELRAVAALPSGGIVVTNLPAQVAWYARRAAVALPNSVDDFRAIAARHRISGVLVSRLRVGELGNTPVWKDAAAAPLWKRLGFAVARDFGTAVLLVPNGAAHAAD